MQSGKLLGQVDQWILLAIIENGNDTYGTPIVYSIRDWGYDIKSGHLYRRLAHMETRGLVEKRCVHSEEPKRGDRRRYYYTVTIKGLKTLNRILTINTHAVEGYIKFAYVFEGVCQ